MFNVDWQQVAAALVPWFLRRSRLVAWLSVAIKPSGYLWLVFLEDRRWMLFRVRYSGQVIYLEHMLNKLFNSGRPAYTDDTPTGIWIGPGQLVDDGNYIYTQAEAGEESDENRVYDSSEVVDEPNDEIWLYEQWELENLSYDFTVNVPLAVGDVSANKRLYDQIFSWTRNYCQAGKRFKIQNYI